MSSRTFYLWAVIIAVLSIPACAVKNYLEMEAWRNLGLEATTLDGFKFCRRDLNTGSLDCSYGNGGFVIGGLGLFAAFVLAIVGRVKKDKEDIAAYRKSLDDEMKDAEGKSKEWLEREIHNLRGHR